MRYSFKETKRKIKILLTKGIYLLHNRKFYFGVASTLGIVPVIAFISVTLLTRGDPIPEKIARENANTAKLVVTDVTELYPVQTKGIVVPHSTEEIVEAVKAYDHVSIGGGRNSMGGQTASERAVQIDMREFNKILSFSTTTKEITVQAGIRWRDIQDYIDPYNLSVKIMQTYSNFTVGGSLSVNVHGRYIGLGPIILSVKGFTIVLADGSIIHATPEEHADIFYSAIGGMGGIGVITDVTLSLADNVDVERTPMLLKTEEYYNYFKNHVRNDPNVIFHNGDMYPPNFEYVRAVSWVQTDKAPTTIDRLIPRRQDYWKERIAWVVMSEWPKGRWIREYIIDPLLYLGTQPVHTRNYEASYDIAELEPKSRQESSYVLQEYFVPVERFGEWVPKMKKVFNGNNVNVINVSIRHALPDKGAKLAWAQTESFAFVVYYKQGTSEKERAKVADWTREMIDQVISVGGTYYLPYQPHATDDQFHAAYPHAVEYFEIKKLYDPTDKFTNTLWDKYYSDEKLKYYKERTLILKKASTTSEYMRPYDNAYLSIPEWFIVYNSLEYSRALTNTFPSRFQYFTAIREYWKEYSDVVGRVSSSSHDNSDYRMVLRVIGVSYSFELAIKGVYENTLGRFTEWLAQNRPVYEEKVAAQMNRDYGEFVYDYPWYDFPYSNYFRPLWLRSDDTDLTAGQYIRKLERLIILSLELEIKIAYSKIIALVTHEKFGVQDDIIYAIISHDGGVTEELLSAPHYQPFTRALIHEMDDAYLYGKDFLVLDISGNQKITFSFLIPEGATTSDKITEMFRTEEGFFNENNIVVTKERVLAELRVADIFSVYRDLRNKGLTIDHFYDY
jgi:FAD/FMN-containing dehydrogenase